MKAWTCHVVTGETVALEWASHTTIADLQGKLESVTSINIEDQVLICNKAPLHSKSSWAVLDVLRALPSPVPPLFLYSKQLLSPNAPLPEDVTLPDPPLGHDGSDVGSCSEIDDLENRSSSEIGVITSSDFRFDHPLTTASSPLLRALPQYRQEFAHHYRRARTAAAAGAARVALCSQYIEECEVRALCVDAAMESVEPTYDSICFAQKEFSENFQQKYAIHDEILSSFEQDLEFLSRIKLPDFNLCDDGRHPPSEDKNGDADVQSIREWHKLSDFIDSDSLSDLAAESMKSHRQFAARVHEFHSLHKGLQNDVEALFMKAPCIDIAELSHGLEAARLAAEEQETAAQAMQAGLQRAENAMEFALEISKRAEDSGSPGSGYSSVQDSIAALEAIHEAHTVDMQPRISACAEIIEAFAAKCVASRNSLVKDAILTLRSISTEQSKIRELRESLAPFKEALNRQDSRIEQLLIVRKLPSCYKHALAECARRHAFSDKFSAFSADLAEKMGKFRNMELSFRESFRNRVQGVLPSELLAALGLESSPPYCEVNISGDDRNSLLYVDVQELKNFRLPWHRISLKTDKSNSPRKEGTKLKAGSTPNFGIARSKSAPHAHKFSFISHTVNSSAEESPQDLDIEKKSSNSEILNRLYLENARLRADLASHIALECVRLPDLSSTKSKRYHAEIYAGKSIGLNDHIKDKNTTIVEAKPGKGWDVSVGEKHNAGLSPMNQSFATSMSSSSLSSTVSSSSELNRMFSSSQIGLSKQQTLQCKEGPERDISDIISKFEQALAAKDAVIMSLEKKILSIENIMEESRERKDDEN